MAQRFRGLVLLVLLLGFTLTMAPAALANSGPPRMSGDKAGAILPGTSSQMHVLRERLRFELDQALALAKVTARYEMENRGPALEQFPVIFVTQERHNGGNDLKATWNGQPLQVTLVETGSLAPAQAEEMARAWTAMTTVIDPVSGERLPAKDWYGAGAVQYYRFVLDVPAGAAGTLEVQYEHAAAEDRVLRVNPIYHYQYLLLPARGWASFGPLEISVKVPGPEANYFASTLPMTYQDGEYRASLPGLPEENLAFSLMSREHILFNWTTGGPYLGLAGVISLVGAVLLALGIGWISGLIRSRGWAIAVAILAGLLAGGPVLFVGILGVISSFELMSQGYGPIFGGLLIWVILVPVETTIAAVYAGRRSARRLRQAGQASA